MEIKRDFTSFGCKYRQSLQPLPWWMRSKFLTPKIRDKNNEALHRIGLLTAFEKIFW